MAVTAKPFYRGDLPGSSATLYTVPSGRSAIVTSILCANNDSVTRTCTVALDGKVIFPAIALPMGKAVSVDLKQVLTAGMVISGFCSSAGEVSAHISGVEVS